MRDILGLSATVRDFCGLEQNARDFYFKGVLRARRGLVRLGQNARLGSDDAFLSVFGHDVGKGVQGRGVGGRVNPPPNGVLKTTTEGSTDFRWPRAPF